MHWLQGAELLLCMGSNVDNSLPAIKGPSRDKQNQVSVRERQIAWIKTPHIFEIATPDGQHLSIGGGVDIQVVNRAIWLIL